MVWAYMLLFSVLVVNSDRFQILQSYTLLLFPAFITCYTAGEELASFPGYHAWAAQEPGNEAGEELVSFPGSHEWAAQEPGNEAGEELALFPGSHAWAAQEPGK